MSAEPVALDSNALRAIVERDIPALTALAGHDLVLPVVVLDEAISGRILQSRKAEQKGREDLVAVALDYLADLYDFAREVVVLRYNRAAQEIYRSLRTGRGNRSRSDLRIAAICLAYEVPLMTRNVADFHDIPDLRVITW